MVKAIQAKGPEKHCSDKTDLKLIDRTGRDTRHTLIPGDLAEINEDPRYILSRRYWVKRHKPLPCLFGSYFTSGIYAHMLAPDQMGISMDAIN